MIDKMPTQQQLDEWKATWLQYKDRLRPNRKSGVELIEYLNDNYEPTEIYDARARETVRRNVTMNAPYAEKLPHGKAPHPRAFMVRREGREVFVGIDMETGYYLVEGDTALWDALCAYQGLDEMDLQNYVCVAQYLQCLKSFGLTPEWRSI